MCVTSPDIWFWKQEFNAEIEEWLCFTHMVNGQDMTSQDDQDIMRQHLFIVVAISKASLTVPIATEIKSAVQEWHRNANLEGRSLMCFS